MFHAQIDLAVNDREFGGNAWDPRNCVHILREVVLDEGLRECVTLTNYLTVPIAFWMELDVEADFADIFEVRGWLRSGRGTCTRRRRTIGPSRSAIAAWTASFRCRA